MTFVLQYQPIRAPRRDGECLIEPALERAGELIEDNRRARAAALCRFGESSLLEFSARARSELRARAARYTGSYRDVTTPLEHRDPAIVLTGHQPQLFHPGVWFKNFALSELGRRLPAHAINLLIDNDTVRTTSIPVPTGDAQQPHIETVDFDRPGDEIPFEERTILDLPRFQSFGPRVADALAGIVPQPLVNALWPLAIQAADHTPNLGRCLAEARHRLEEPLGLVTLEVPLSEVCESEYFFRFAWRVLEDLPHWHTTYNGGLAEYRAVNRIRSRSHPVPDLVVESGWHEAPFWVWSREQPRRRRLFVRDCGTGLELTDREHWQFALPAGMSQQSASVVRALREQLASVVRLRPRALTTTMYARLVLGDLFLHGIGGAKYDQLTDLILDRFFGVPPPKFVTLSATAMLFADRTPELRSELREIERGLRELRFHPEKYLTAGTNAAKWITRKRRWISTAPRRGQELQRHREIERANREMLAGLTEFQQVWESRREQLVAALRRQAPLGSREFSFCLFPAEKLPRLLLEFCHAVP